MVSSSTQRCAQLSSVTAQALLAHPPSKTPIFQAVIFRNRLARGRLVASLNYSDTFN
jgi:hypothetical protein